MSYIKINWTDTPTTPLCADNLNNMDNGIYNNDAAILFTENTIATNKTLTDNKIDVLSNFVGLQNLMINNVKFASTTNWSVVDAGYGTVSASNGLLSITINTAGKYIGVYGKLTKSIIFDAAQSKIALIKIRLKSSDGATIRPVWRYGGVNGKYITAANIIASSISYLNGWQITDSNWHNLWAVVQLDSTATADLSCNEFGIFVGGDDSTCGVQIQRFDVLYGGD